MIITGKALWAHVWTPEEFNGQEIGYSIQVIPNKDDLERLKGEFVEMFMNEAKYGTLKGKKHKLEGIHLPIKETKEGEEALKCKTNHFYVDRNTGQRVKKTLAVLNKYGEPLADGTLIGNGSLVQVKVKPSVYYQHAANYGITLYIEAILVKDLVEYNGKDAKSYGFDIVEKTEVDFDTNEEDFVEAVPF